jgi:fermentation-respiration switch protein FrsA (DUF1100 family)
LYARKLAEHGLVASAFDASYQRESTGKPRQLENPYIRTENVSAVVNYLTALPYVDPNGVGAWAFAPEEATPPTRRSTTVASRPSGPSVRSSELRIMLHKR